MGAVETMNELDSTANPAGDEIGKESVRHKSCSMALSGEMKTEGSISVFLTQVTHLFSEPLLRSQTTFCLHLIMYICTYDVGKYVYLYGCLLSVCLNGYATGHIHFLWDK